MTPAVPVQTLLQSRATALLAALPPALAGEVTAVHQARVASRRLREVLATVRQLHPGDTVDRASRDVRRVTRALGAVRELDVSRELFEALVPVHALELAAQVAIRRSLASARAAALRSARRRLPAAKTARLHHALETLGQEILVAPAAPIGDVLGTRIAKRAARLGGALEHAGTVYVPVRLHDVRIAVKQLRYALEVSGEAGHTRVTARLRQLKAIQELLGQVHDRNVLEDRLRRVQIHVVRTSRRTAREVRRLAKAIDQSCRELHAAFMSRRPALAALVVALSPTPAVRRPRSAA